MRDSRRSTVPLALALLALSLVAANCKAPVAKEKAEEEESAKGPQAVFLSLGDFTSSKQRMISADDLVSSLNGRSEFQADPKDDGPSSACDQVYESIKAKATKGQMTVSVDLDLTACTKKDRQTSLGQSYAEAIQDVRLQMFVDLRCEGGDLSALDGKILDQLEDTRLEPCLDRGGTRSTTLMQSKFSYKATYEEEIPGSSEKTTGKVDIVMLTHSGSSATEGCALVLANGAATQMGSCLVYNITRDGVGASEDEVFNLTESGLSHQADDLYFRTGDIAVELNSWRGTMNFSGATMPPTWSMASGAEQRTGVYSPDDSATPTGGEAADSGQGLRLSGREKAAPSAADFRKRFRRWLLPR